jgi:putative transposase
MPRVRHSHDDWAIFHVTTRTLGKQFLLAGDEAKLLVVNSLAYYRQKGVIKLLGFVVMDNHVHLLLCPVPPFALSEFMRDWKRWTSRHNLSKPPGDTLWERRYDDNRISRTRELAAVMEYIHANPVRAGIVDRPGLYPWSSVHNYLLDGKSVIGVDTDWLEPSL